MKIIQLEINITFLKKKKKSLLKNMFCDGEMSNLNILIFCSSLKEKCSEDEQLIFLGELFNFNTKLVQK